MNLRRQRVDSATLEKARHLRKHMPQAERALWQHLRAKKLGVPFRRQVVIAGYIVDFWCPFARLAIEVDGSWHDSEIDGRRDLVLQSMGIKVLRLSDALSAETMAREIVEHLPERRDNLPRKKHGQYLLWPACRECAGTGWVPSTEARRVSRCACRKQMPLRFEDEFARDREKLAQQTYIAQQLASQEEYEQFRLRLFTLAKSMSIAEAIRFGAKRPQHAHFVDIAVSGGGR